MTETKSIDEIEVGEAVVSEPIDGVELTFYGLADESAESMTIEAEVHYENGQFMGMYLYQVVDVDEEEEKFVSKPDGRRNKRAEEAIEEAGGKIQN